MKTFVYPAIFIKDEEDEVYRVLFPDLDITTDGAFMEEAFLYAKESLKTYFAYIEKYDFDFNEPTDYEMVKESCDNKDVVMLIDAQLSLKDEYED